MLKNAFRRFFNFQLKSGKMINIKNFGLSNIIMFQITLRWDTSNKGIRLEYYKRTAFGDFGMFLFNMENS